MKILLMRIRSTVAAILVLAGMLVQSRSLSAEPIPVKCTEGTVHGFLSLRTEEGKVIASGDLIQTVQGERAVSRLIFRFRDGSLDNETAVFTQRGHFRLLSDHHIQRGPSFPKPTDLRINAVTGQVTVRYKDNGKEKVETDHLDLPPDVANGIILDVLKNVSPHTEKTEMSYVVAAPKPKLVHLSIKPEGEDTFSVAGRREKAIRFVIKVEFGGITGLIAPIIGKQPADTYVWVSSGEAPAFVKSEGPSYDGAPIWRTEMISPVWGQETQSVQSRP